MQERIYRELRTLLQGTLHVLYHVGVIALSTAIAVSLPALADTFLVLWSFLQHGPRFILYAEVCLAVLLIALFNYVVRSSRDRRLAQIAQDAGLDRQFLARGPLVSKRIRRLKAAHGLARRIMIIGSTGYKSLVDPDGELHAVIGGCLQAEIMLLNPYSQGARIRANTLEHKEVTIDSLVAQVRITIDFLKSVQTSQRIIRLKLYSDVPHVKLAILGEHIWMQHYHTSLDVQTMPEYVLVHNQKPSGLYTLFYEYFLVRWNSADIPEYDLETDELVYRDRKGGERGREPFPWNGMLSQRRPFADADTSQLSGSA